MKRRHLLVCSVLLLAGCATAPIADKRVRSGRFSLQIIRRDERNSLAGRWRLQESAGEIELTLMTPLYGILARIRVGENGATLERPNKEGGNAIETAESAQALMLRHLGFSLPPEMLASWLSGTSWAGAAAEQTAEGFVQAGWQVVVKRLKPDGSPALVTLAQPETALQAAITVNLVIE